ncbi:MAG TPA: VWA domain-containing protein [Thermoanaerobaculia bacterium]|jgi:VWFA-related protein|nr:VWA domain-containing protein [Thermoanaerobaculia bacterium]
MRFSRVLLPAVLILAATPITYAVPQHRETTTVEVVQIPVYVTSSGASVRGLTRDDFKLRVNGQTQKIDYFDVVDFSSLSSEQMRDPRQRRLYVLTFDLANMSQFALPRAQRAAEEYLAAAQPSDSFAVALLGHDNQIRFIVPFTRDRATLRRAVASFRVASPGDPLRLTLAWGERTALINDDAAELMDLRRMGAGVTAELVADMARRRVDDQFESLGNLARRLAPLEGYKHVVLLSRGFDSFLLGGGLSGLTGRSPLAGPLTGEGPQQQGNAFASPGQQGQGAWWPVSFHGFDSWLPESQRRMQKEFTDAGVFLDAIDIEGVRPIGMGSNESLHFLVSDTGGQVVEHRNDLKAAIQRLTDSQQVVYVLGFHAADTGRKQNTISVDVTGAPRRSYVFYRQSYTTIADKPPAYDGLRLADIVTNDIPENGITMTTTVTTAPKTAAVSVTLPGQELLAIAGNDGNVKGEALLYVFLGQTSVSFARKGIDVDVTRARTGGLDGRNVEIAQSFDLPPGTYALKVLVRLEGHDTLAFARKDFTIGE